MNAATAVSAGREHVSATLAAVGQELVRAMAKPTIFERLCAVTADALAGDACCTLLRDGQRRSFLPVARTGAARDFAHLADPNHPVAIDVLRGLRTANVVEVVLPPDGDRRTDSRWLCIALRRGTKLAGIVVAGRLAGLPPFSPDDVAIAEGIGRLGSMCVENARLMAEIERVNHIKSDFVATMSHELRTPLNIILGYLSLLLDGDFGALDEGQRAVVGQIDRSAHALLELVQDTLDLSRLESNALPISRNEIVVGDLLATLARDTERLPRADAVEVRWDAAEPLPVLVSDRGKLRIVLSSLIANALKFTAKGTVSVAARPCAEGVEFSVADTGAGIPRDEFSRIFEPFTQLGETATRTHGGVGMGLYVARRLAELLGGAIGVSSRVGSGSTFRVWIPAVAPTASCDLSSLDRPAWRTPLEIGETR